MVLETAFESERAFTQPEFAAWVRKRTHDLMRSHALLLACLLGAVAPLAAAQERTAVEILRELDRVRFPSMSAGNSPEALAEFERAIRDASETVARLALELERAHPGHARVPEALGQRWALLTNALGRAPEVVDETAARLEDETPPAVRAEALVARAWAGAQLEDVVLSTALEWADRAAAAAPDDERCAVTLMHLAKRRSIDPEEQRALVERVLESYPGAEWARADARSLERALARAGAPLELAFADALSGRRISLADFAGTWVVVHVWLSSQPSSEEDLARLSRLRAAPPDQGLALLGIHSGAPEGGLDGLRAWLEERGCDWPQRCEPELDRARDPWGFSETPLYLLVAPGGEVAFVTFSARCVERYLAARRSV